VKKVVTQTFLNSLFDALYIETDTLHESGRLASEAPIGIRGGRAGPDLF
jgi:hypothetical protein